MIYICNHLKNPNIDIDEKYFKIINVTDFDNSDDLILQSQKYFNEFTVAYYIYKNKIYNNEPWVGFCHYRRILKLKDINIERILKNHELQYFYEMQYTWEPEYNKQLYDYEYPRIAEFLNNFSTNDMFYNDICEYINTCGNEEDKKHFKNICSINSYYDANFIVKSIYITTIDIFEQICEFIINYIRFIFDKYNINSLVDFILHIDTNMKHNLRVSSYTMIPGNNMRIYAYIIEILTGMYCMKFDTFKTHQYRLEMGSCSCYNDEAFSTEA